MSISKMPLFKNQNIIVVTGKDSVSKVAFISLNFAHRLPIPIQGSGSPNEFPAQPRAVKNVLHQQICSGEKKRGILSVCDLILLLHAPV